VPGPYAKPQREILTRIENVPSILQQGSENLDKAPGAVHHRGDASARGVQERLQENGTALRSVTHAQRGGIEMGQAIARPMRWNIFEQTARAIAIVAKETALGRDAYLFFLKKRRPLSLFAGTNFGNGTTGMEPGVSHLKAMRKNATKMSRTSTRERY